LLFVGWEKYPTKVELESIAEVEASSSGKKGGGQTQAKNWKRMSARGEIIPDTRSANIAVPPSLVSLVI
jgi:hypothetical protein